LARNVRDTRARRSHWGTTLGERRLTEEKSMLWTIIVILLILWLLGLIGQVGGGLIWLLLVVAGVVLVYQLLTGRRTV
jgi:4-hydroxybenzoate polyprenyltransferase